jgi:sugar phosphate isomerase/epimerase
MLFEAFETPLAGVRHLGVNALELELSHEFEAPLLDTREKVCLTSDEAVVAYRRHLDSLNIHPSSFLTACDFSAGDIAANAGWVARAIEIASIMGMDNIRIDSAMARERELDFSARVALFAEGLGEALRRTGGLSVAMGIENHGFQGNNLAFLLNVFQRVDSDRLGSTLDTGNFYWRGYPLSEVYGILAILAPYAKHTHLKNIQYPAELREQVREAGWGYETHVAPLDEGDIDHAVVLRILRDAGYAGDLCIEDESLGKYSPEERVRVLERDVAHVKGLLAALAD